MLAAAQHVLLASSKFSDVVGMPCHTVDGVGACCHEVLPASTLSYVQ